MIFRSSRNLSILATLILSAAWLTSCSDRAANVAAHLNLPRLPASARVMDCVSPSDALTDLRVKCTVTVAPTEFPLLLQGSPFQQMGNDYKVWPKQFEYGGFVRVEPNAARDQAVIDVFIE